MPPPIDDVKNWMNMFRWIVKMIRDEYEVDEALLTRTAALADRSHYRHCRGKFQPQVPTRNTG
jgi:hypothetical protein